MRLRSGRLVIAFAPHRDHLRSVRLDGVRAEPLGTSGLLWEIPRERLPQQRPRARDVRANGAPARARVLYLEESSDDSRSARERVHGRKLGDWTMRLLRDRARRIQALPKRRKRRAFLLAFDFLTHPSMTAFWGELGRRDLERAIPAEEGLVRRILTFLPASMDVLAPLGRVRHQVTLALEHRLRTLARTPGRIWPRMGEEGDALDGEARDDVARVAAWLERLFLEFAPKDEPESVWKALLSFADARLWSGPDVPVPEMLNGSPDSPLFFGLAEFALAAAGHADNAGYWEDLAHVAVELETVYLRRFAPLPEHRSSDEYGYTPKGRHPHVRWRRFRARLDRPVDERELLERHSVDYLRALWNDVDAVEGHPAAP